MPCRLCSSTACPTPTGCGSDVLAHLDRATSSSRTCPGSATNRARRAHQGEVRRLAGRELEAAGEPVDLVGHDWGSILVVGRDRTARPHPDPRARRRPGRRDLRVARHAQLWQTPEVGEQVMEGHDPRHHRPGFEAAGLTPDEATSPPRDLTPR